MATLRARLQYKIHRHISHDIQVELINSSCLWLSYKDERHRIKNNAKNEERKSKTYELFNNPQKDMTSYESHEYKSGQNYLSPAVFKSFCLKHTQNIEK